ncbi:MAG TPA: TonB family protein [Gemmatimonadaceae bacterium]|jgi:protein TonB
MRSILVAVVAVSSALSSAGAQTIAGRVLDKQSRKPLNRVSIQLVADTGAVSKVLAQTTSDTSGIFYVEAPAVGTYRLLFGVSNASLLSAPLVVKDSDVQREYLIDLEAERSYFEFQVEKQVEMLPNQPRPKYPQALRDANIEGEVLVQFVVDSAGHPEMWTFKVLRSPHYDFSESVRSAVSHMRFAPAQIQGRKVKQLVQMPFVFGLNR